VSRWMTWLPISVKNAAKCDKWYVLQNHSITESLNAKGAREKLFASDPRACRNLSVERKKYKKLLLLIFLRRNKQPFNFVVSRSCRGDIIIFSAIRGSLAFPSELGKKENAQRTTKTSFLSQRGSRVLPRAAHFRLRAGRGRSLIPKQKASKMDSFLVFWWEEKKQANHWDLKNLGVWHFHFFSTRFSTKEKIHFKILVFLWESGSFLRIPNLDWTFWESEKNNENRFNFFFTDLSAVGLPAELKHITQRRKRKQPWFP